MGAELGEDLRVVIIGSQEPGLSIEVPPVPDALRPNLRTAALTAFYTPLHLVAVIWQAVEQLSLF